MLAPEASLKQNKKTQGSLTPLQPALRGEASTARGGAPPMTPPPRPSLPRPPAPWRPVRGGGRLRVGRGVGADERRRAERGGLPFGAENGLWTARPPRRRATMRAAPACHHGTTVGRAVAGMAAAGRTPFPHPTHPSSLSRAHPQVYVGVSRAAVVGGGGGRNSKGVRELERGGWWKKCAATSGTVEERLGGEEGVLDHSGGRSRAFGLGAGVGGRWEDGGVGACTSSCTAHPPARRVPLP